MPPASLSPVHFVGSCSDPAKSGRICPCHSTSGAATPSESTPEALQWSAGSVETCPLLPILFPPHFPFHPSLLCPRLLTSWTLQPIRLTLTCTGCASCQIFSQISGGFLPHPLAYSFIFAQKQVRLPLKTYSSFTPKPAFPAILSHRTPGS